MKTFNKKQILSMMLAVLLMPAAVSAGVYFMEAKDESAEAGQLVIPCMINYPKTTCPDGKTPQNFCPTDSRYFKTCGCDTSVYQYTASNCTGNKTLGGNTCDSKYSTCTCDTKYQYTTSNCTGGKTLGGNSCDSKYETCGCDTTYTKTCNTNNLIPADTNDSCDGKYKTCKCPTSYLTCDNGGAVGATQCTEEDGTVKYSSCKIACDLVKYRWNNSNCNGVPYGESCDGKYSKCEWIVYAGDIVYSDGTISADKINGKTAIGIVFSKDPDQMMALDFYTTWWAGQENDKVSCKKPESSIISSLSKSSGAALNDMDGFGNTYCIKEAADRLGTKYPVFEYIWKFSAGDKPAGHWYAPAMGQYFIMRNNIIAINSAREKLGLENSLYTTLGSSNESGPGSYYYWVEHFSSHYSTYSKKNPNWNPNNAGINVHGGHAPTIYPIADLCKRDSRIVNGVCLAKLKVGCPSGYVTNSCSEYQSDKISDNGDGFCYLCKSWNDICGKCNTLRNTQVSRCQKGMANGTIGTMYPQEMPDADGYPLSDGQHYNNCMNYADNLLTNCKSSNSSWGCPSAFESY